MPPILPCSCHVFLLVFGCVALRGSFGLNNGVERTPAMGFMDWERYRCNVDCAQFPDECISERLFKRIADAMVTKGLQQAGYVYVSIDDCWMSKHRTKDGKLEADPARFPSGMRALADYMHERGLKLGIYADYGTETCGGYPGSQGYEVIDANTFAEWKVDMLKFDGCYSNASAKAVGYIEMGRALNATGRPILYDCSWPAYISNPNYTIISDICNQWRNQGDIQDSFGSVAGIIAAYYQNQDQYAKFNGPGHFNDPDELLIGDKGLSIGQQKIQMAVWSMWSAPLFVSADLTQINDASLSILLNRNLIRINQDPAGAFGKLVKAEQDGGIQVWMKPLSDKQFGKAALCYFNQNYDDLTQIVTYSLKDLGVSRPGVGKAFALMDVFTSRIVSKLPMMWDEPFDVFVPAFETMTFVVKEVSLYEYCMSIFEV